MIPKAKPMKAAGIFVSIADVTRCRFNNQSQLKKYQISWVWLWILICSEIGLFYSYPYAEYNVCMQVPLLMFSRPLNNISMFYPFCRTMAIQGG